MCLSKRTILSFDDCIKIPQNKNYLPLKITFIKLNSIYAIEQKNKEKQYFEYHINLSRLCIKNFTNTYICK